MHELMEYSSGNEHARDMVNIMKDIMESCGSSKSVLDDFSICESIINGESSLAAKEVYLIPRLKTFLANFYKDHVRILTYTRLLIYV